jgi:hypothetical protein
VVGYAVFAGSSELLFSAAGRQPQESAPFIFMLGSTLLGMFFAGLGGYLASLIGGHRDTALAITVLIALGGLVSLFGDTGSHWSQIAALVFMSPMSAFGGRLIKAQAPLVSSKKKISGTHIVTVPEKGFQGIELRLDVGSVDLHSFADYRGYEAPDSDVVALLWEGSGPDFCVVGDSAQASKQAKGLIKRLEWVFEGVSFFDVGARDPDVPESEDRTLDEYEVLGIDPQYRIRLKFRGGVIIEVVANSTHVVISS